MLFVLLSVLPFLVFAEGEAMPAAETPGDQLQILVKPPGTIRLGFSPVDPSQQFDVPDITSLSLGLRLDPADGLFGNVWVYREIRGFNSGYEVALTAITPFSIAGNQMDGDLSTIPYGLFLDDGTEASVSFSEMEHEAKTLNLVLFSSDTPKTWFRKLSIASTLPEGFRYDAEYGGRMTFTVTILE